MRLTNTDRDGIVRRAIEARFTEPRQEIAREKERLGAKLYDLAFTKKARDWAAQDPGGKWLHRDKCLRFNLSGHRIKIDMTEGRAVPYDAGYCRELITVADEALRDEHMALDRRSSQIDKDAEAAKAQLGGLLGRITTLNKLREIWPEGEPFYAHLAPRERIDVPAVQVADINKLLGIAA